MSARRLFVVAALAVVAASGRASPVRAEPSSPAWMPTVERIEALRAELDVPGVAVVGLEDCRPGPPVLVGRAAIAPDRPVTERTVFEAASLSKPVFAYLVLALAEEGVLDLDEPIARRFDHPRIADARRYALLTPRLLLSHRGGLPNWAGDPARPDRTTPLAFVGEPGGAYAYSGEGYELLAAFVEARTGRTLDALFRERLGVVMPHSAFAPPLAAEAEPAKGYRRAGEPESGRGLVNLRASGGAAGGLVTTASDYARFLALLCDGAGLSAASHARMLAPLTPLPEGDFPAPAAYGLGWVVMTTEEGLVALHDGDNEQFRTFAAFSPTRRDGVVILTNGRYGGDLIEALLEAMR